MLTDEQIDALWAAAADRERSEPGEYDRHRLMLDFARAVLAAQEAQEPTTAEQKLTNAGVFKGAHGLRGLAEAQEFWDKQPYGTRLYYGDGAGDYLQRGVLRAAVKALDAAPVAAASPPPGYVLVPLEPTGEMRFAGGREARKHTYLAVDGLATEATNACRLIYKEMLAARPQPAPLPQTEQPTDGEMLDWLEAKHFTLHASRESAGDDELTLWWQVQDSKKSISGHPLGNARAAIAAAMKGQQP